MYVDLNKKVNDYIIYQVIASGSFGKVYRAVKKNQTQIYAIKVIQKNTLQQISSKTQTMYKMLHSEIAVMQKCKSDYIVKLFEVIESEEKYYLVLEYCGQLNLQGYLKKVKYIQQLEAIAILKQIIWGITALHAIPAIHRDLKPQNILRKQGKFKIGDLGFSKVLKQKDDVNQSTLGTPSYMAPQIIYGKQYNSKVDIWSLGIIFYRMLYGQLPYKFKSTLQNHMVELLKKPLAFAGKQLSEQTINFLQGCLQIDAQKRMTWQQIIHHPILQSDSDIAKASQVIVRQSIVGLQLNFKEKQQNLGIKKNYPKIKCYETVQKQEIKKIVDYFKQIQRTKLEFEQYTRIILKQKQKLVNLFTYAVDIKNVQICEEFSLSRRLTELRLFITYRCMKKVEYLLKFFKKSDNIFKFPKYDKYCQSYQFKELTEDYNIMYKKCSKYYQKISQILEQFENKFSHILKDKFKQILSGQKSKTKNKFLTGVQNMDYTLDQHNKFVISYFKDQSNNFKQKIQQLITKNKDLYLFLLILKYYQFLATLGSRPDDDYYQKQLQSQLKQALQWGKHENWNQRIRQIINDIY